MRNNVGQNGGWVNVSDETTLVGSESSAATFSGAPPRKHRISDVRGWLMLLCISMMLVVPGYSVFLLMAAIPLVPIGFAKAPAAGVIVAVVCAVMAILATLSFLAGYGLLTGRKDAVAQAKRFLLLSLTAQAAIGVLIVVAASDWSAAAQTVAQSLLYSGVWYSYLARSKRVKAMYLS
jgi:hypothetical protein